MEPVETIRSGGTVLAYILRREFEPAATTFPVPAEHNLQVGLVVYPAGGEVVRHLHMPVERHTVGTHEALLVRKGRCIADLYAEDRTLVASCELKVGDVILLVGGGHGFRMQEDTVLLEFKQGPYSGLVEKERF